MVIYRVATPLIRSGTDKFVISLGLRALFKRVTYVCQRHLLLYGSDVTVMFKIWLESVEKQHSITTFAHPKLPGNICANSRQRKHKTSLSDSWQTVKRARAPATTKLSCHLAPHPSFRGSSPQLKTSSFFFCHDDDDHHLHHSSRFAFSVEVATWCE